MANQHKSFSNTTADGAPTTGQADVQVILLNTYSGRMFFKKTNPSDAIVEMISNLGGQTINGDLTLTGNLTSLGIDDNATAEKLQLGNGAMLLGSAGASFQIGHRVDNEFMQISSGAALNNGMVFTAYGGTHALTGQWSIDVQNSRMIDWDEFNGRFRIYTGTGSKTQAFEIDSSQDTTFAGAVDVEGAFTSIGIDDNATGERLELSDTFMALGDASAAEAYTIGMRTTTDGVLQLTGDVTSSAGANIQLYGSTHLTVAGDMRLRSGTTNFAVWDESAGSLAISTGAGATKAINLTLSGLVGAEVANFVGAVTVNGRFTSIGIDDNADSEMLEISNGVVRIGDGSAGEVATIEMRTTDDGRLDLNGGNLSAATIGLFGSTHASRANDTRFLAAGNSWMDWDESDGEWTLSTGVGAKTTALTLASNQYATFSSGLEADYMEATNGSITVRAEDQQLLLHDTLGTDTADKARFDYDNEVLNIGIYDDSSFQYNIAFKATLAGAAELHYDGVKQAETANGSFEVITILNAQAALTVNGAFTSIGIDDNATVETLELADNTFKFGTSVAASSLQISRPITDGVMQISGGSSTGLGGNIYLAGESHSTVGDVRLRVGANTFFDWDEDAGELQLLTGVGSKTLAMTIDSGQDATFAGDVTLGDNNPILTIIDGNATDATTYQGGILFQEGSTNTSVGRLEFVSSSSNKLVLDSDGQVEIRTNSNQTALTIDSSQDSTFSGDLLVEGLNFTIGDAGTNTGIIKRGRTDASLNISAGTGVNNSMQITMFGSTHASQAYDLLFRRGGSTLSHFDDSAGTWAFSSGSGGALDTFMSAAANRDVSFPNAALVTMQNMVFDADQTIGAGQDDYVLTYDDGTGLISLEAAGGGGLFSEDGDGNIVGGTGAGANLTAASALENFLGGQDAGSAITTGDYNVAIGYQAMHDATAALTGNDNIAIGRAMDSAAMTTADHNIAMGENALDAVTTANNTIALGQGALGLLQDGHLSIGIGQSAGAAMVSNQIIALGDNALASATGDGNVGIGQFAGWDIVAGTFNTIVGDRAGRSITSGSHNIAIGNAAMGNFAGTGSGADNIAIGRNTMAAGTLTTAALNIAIGLNALDVNTTGSSNIAIGENALEAMDSGSENIAIGKDALSLNVLGSNHVAIGARAGEQLTDFTVQSIFIGEEAGQRVTSGTYAIGIGAGALKGSSASKLTGARNMAMGYLAGGGNGTGTTMSDTVALGWASLLILSTGASNVAVGNETLRYGQTLARNTAVGDNAGSACANGSNDNVMIGFDAMSHSSGVMTGDFNVAVGSGAMDTGASLTTATGNVGVGYESMDGLTTGDDNTAIGRGTGDKIGAGDNNVMIGLNAGPTSNQSSKLYINDAESDNPLIYGDFAAGAEQVRFNGAIGELVDTAVGTTGAQTVDITDGTYQYMSGAMTGAITWTFTSTNLPSGHAFSFILEGNDLDGFASTWPTSVDWPGGTEPTWTTGVDIITFITRDGGTTWHGMATSLGSA